MAALTHAAPGEDYAQVIKWIFPTVSNSRLALALLIPRCFVGIAFIQHGSGKLPHPSEFAAEFGIPVRLGLATMLTQCIGAILLILGALTPLAALSIAATMITATIFLIGRGARTSEAADKEEEKPTEGILNGKESP